MYCLGEYTSYSTPWKVISFSPFLNDSSLFGSIVLLMTVPLLILVRDLKSIDFNISQLDDTLFIKLKGNCFLSFLTISARAGSGSIIS